MRIPNTAVDVVVGASASGKDLPEVQRALAGQSNKLLAYLKGQQVERLITTSVSFSPSTKSVRSGPDKTVGYDGSARISFRAKPDTVADILAEVLVNGANEIQSTTFTPTEQEIAAARRQLSEDATKTAVAQADAIAKAARMKVVAIRNISVDNDNLSFSPRPGLTQVNEFDAMAKMRTTPMDTASGDEQLSHSREYHRCGDALIRLRPACRPGIGRFLRLGRACRFRRGACPAGGGGCGGSAARSRWRGGCFA